MNTDERRAASQQSESLSTTHKDNKQVQLDVIRSMCNFGMRKTERERRLSELATVINSVLAANPDLHYYQGYNDVCSIVILVMGDVDNARRVAERLAKQHLREAMNPTLMSVQQALQLVVRIVQRRDKALWRALEEIGVDPVFALSWILTWFAHDLHSLSQIERLYDFFVASHPLMSLYVSAAVLCYFRQPILAAGGDYSVVHGLMQSLPSDLPIDRLILDAYRSFERAPPPSVIAAASLDRERAFTPDSTWRVFPPGPVDSPLPHPDMGRLIAWKRPPAKRAWRRSVVSGQVGVILLGGIVLVRIAPKLLQTAR